MTTLILYNWRYWDEIRGKHIVTRWKATEEEIKRQHPDATPMLDTREIREVSDDPFDNSMGHLLRGSKDHPPR